MNCPRCLCPGIDDVLSAITVCPFCCENYRRMLEDKPLLDEPTERYPAWEPSKWGVTA